MNLPAVYLFKVLNLAGPIFCFCSRHKCTFFSTKNISYHFCFGFGKINLVRTLGEARSKLAQHKLPQNPGAIPLVQHVESYAGNGFLSDRQQMWAEGMPNDDFTENPVLYK